MLNNLSIEDRLIKLENITKASNSALKAIGELVFFMEKNLTSLENRHNTLAESVIEICRIHGEFLQSEIKNRDLY